MRARLVGRGARDLRSTARLLVVAATPVLAGCFAYVPAQMEGVPAGQEVRVQLSRRGMAELPVEIAQDDGYLRGSYAGQGGDSVRVQVAVAARQVGFLNQELRQEVRVPTAEVVQIERREFSRGRTALLAAAVVAGGVAIVSLISGSIDGAGDGPPDDDLTRVPLFSVRFIGP